MMLGSYWPKAAAVNACIKNEAETAHVSVLLAVHQPSPLVKRDTADGSLTPSTEMELLEAFMTDNVPGGALLMPITGPSGVGKSHIIRWLDAQLQRSAKRGSFHIICIPKSASLRTVVELIVAPLADDPRYAKAREDLTRAVAEVNIKDAVVIFRGHLENALSAARERLIGELREHPERTNLKALIGHAGMLPRLFSDAALDQHFAEHVLSRIVARSLSGRSDGAEGDETAAQFTVDDLILPSTVALNQAAQPVRDYYQRNIAPLDAERLQPVVDLLNEAVDPAIGNVFQLEQSTGGMTLQDIILAVREILLSDGRDLVLLVEDFAALAGIQEVLLKVCIQEGERGGKKVRATMRTALALTDGYLSFRHTILTRAQREWVIGGRAQSDDEIKAGVVGMVGAYLNAARWGEDELRRMFEQQGAQDSLTDWLPAWRDEGLSEEESEALGAFGTDTKGDALFPFNRQAIEQLAERHLTQNARLIFNPRRVINEILRNTLLLRSVFEARSFPPAGFQEARPNGLLANWIRQSHQPEPIARRLSTLFAIWGGNPADPAQIAHIPPAIFSTFNLPTPADLANVSYVPEVPAPTLTITSGDSGAGRVVNTQVLRSAPAPDDPSITDLSAKLDLWAGGALLGQDEARKIRSALFDMLKDAIDWPSLRICSNDLRAAWISIPHARGNPQSGPQLQVCDDPRDEGGSIRAGLKGAVRFVHVNGKRWSYSQAEDDYVASAAIIDHLVAQLKPMLVDNAKAQVTTVARALITQSRIAGLTPPVRPSGPDAILSSLFAEPIPTDSQAFEENWEKLRQSALGLIGGKPARTVLQFELLARIACFQGDTGRTPFAVDIVRLLEAAGADSTANETNDGLPEEVRAFIRPIADNRLWGQLTAVIAKLHTFRSQIGDFIDENFDKAAFITDLQKIVRLLGVTGTTPANLTMTIKEYERRLTEFQQSAIIELVTKAAVVLDADREQLPKVLNTLGSIDLGLIDRTMSFLTYTMALISAAEASVAREEANRREANPGAIAADLIDLLRLVADHPEVVMEAAE